jgi:hypothetical protein
MNKKISTPLAISIIVVLAVLVGGGVLISKYYYFQLKEPVNIILENPKIDEGQNLEKDGLSLEKIKNAEYFSGLDKNEKIKLVNGSYFKQYPDSASGLSVEIYNNKIVFGDLNKDGKEDAAVVLSTNGGGSGSFRSLVVILNNSGNPVYLTEKSLGDRVIINSINIESGIITLDMLVQGPNDGLCCPTVKEIKKFTLINNQLEEYLKDDISYWETYKNDEYGFEFKYPEGAFDYSNTKSQCTRLAANSNNSFACKLILGNENIGEDFNKMRIKIVYTNADNYLSSPLSDASLVIIGNIKGHKVDYSLSKLKPAVYEEVFYVKIGENTLEIGFPIDTNEDRDRDPLDINKILSTFKITD